MKQQKLAVAGSQHAGHVEVLVLVDGPHVHMRLLSILVGRGSPLHLLNIVKTGIQQKIKHLGTLQNHTVRIFFLLDLESQIGLRLGVIHGSVSNQGVKLLLEDGYLFLGDDHKHFIKL